MEYLFYPGCALEASSAHYGKSAKATMAALGSELNELDDWSCCGATAYVGTDEDKSVAYSARNLALAQSQGAKDLVTACNGCYVMLRKANACWSGSVTIHGHVSRALEAAGLTYDGSVSVRHLAEVMLNDIGVEAISAKVKASLSGLKVAAYHGCQISRPFDDVDNAERPTMLNQLLAATEAEVVPFPLTARCCGGMLMTTRREVALDLVYNILSCARAKGADCIAVACPLCCVNLECYQESISARYGWGEPMPVVPFTQLLGIALDVPARELGLDQCMVDVEPMLARYL
jgi:heterodisulfide reductase subunit B